RRIFRRRYRRHTGCGWRWGRRRVAAQKLQASQIQIRGKLQASKHQAPEKIQTSSSNGVVAESWIECEFSASNYSFSIHGCEDQVRFFCFAVEFSGIVGEGRFGGGDHAEEEFCLRGFFNTAADAIFKIFLRNSFVRFAIICTDTGSTADQLIDEPVVHRRL